ncbi:biotin/lipoyl-binding carrier protein [Belnapia rosea]|jgi:biotin carboxyl carrier protein|uniref:Acetyl-CoA carboxylase biotin carboxyl carrier protein n=1 Tax=Belnapia rosea TaxID=938405 RepID=A0A1G6T1L1_9PROT|nr:biotin/lipoyl-binding carrier protein [Belnapia rosea]SDB59874.1 acetyl-CoA carboxylase biotin carboxyl carrier protein [Belnapia rosea]SDD22436.1 acetyl-CoA carboxylase biotin carboxyl carrier protein [Belnapia rosea]
MADIAVPVEITASVWKIEATPGQAVAAGDVLMILESMKMEIPVESPRAGTVKSILVAEGDQVNEGQVVLLLDA